MFLNCNENLTNSECRFIATIGDITKLKPDRSFSFIEISFFVEIVVILFGLLVSTVSIFVFLQRSSIHYNFTRIVIAFTSNIYVLAICRLVLLLFEAGYLKEQDHSTLVLWASIGHMCETGCGINFFFGLIIERRFATTHIADYELHKRSYISTTVIIVGILQSLIAAIALSIGIFGNILETLVILAIILFGVILFGILLSVYIFRRNKSYYDNVQSRFASSLSTKFQLAENFHVFRALLYIAINMGIAASTGSVLFHLAFYYVGKDDNLSALSSALFNVQHSMRFRAVVSMNMTFVLSLPSWRHDFIQKIRRCMPCIHLPTTHIRQVMHERDVGDHYFNDLIGSWDNHFAVNKRH